MVNICLEKSLTFKMKGAFIFLHSQSKVNTVSDCERFCHLEDKEVTWQKLQVDAKQI